MIGLGVPTLGQGTHLRQLAERKPQLPGVERITFSVGLIVIREQLVLTVAQHEGQEGEDESVSDAEDGKHEGPADGAVPQRVLACLLPTHAPDLT